MPKTSVGDPLVGHVLDGRYEITARLARGGMATVYQAVDLRLTRTVAVKVMHVGLGDDAEFARKFDREARAAARLSHPNVVSVFDQGHDASSGHGRPYIVMEYVDGQTLRDVITREAPLTPLRALEIIEPVLSALACAHESGLVHRDVKPENVLISDRGQIKVADFGLAKAISAQSSTATQGLLIGTVSYLPPELVLSGRADARSDVYSAGVVLFELITGSKPHQGDTPIQVAYAHVHRDVPPPSSRTTAGPVPPYLDALLARVTARNPDVRPPDAKVMLTLVRRVRAALRDGVPEDAELTEDLTLHQRPTDTEPTMPDRADVEVTQLVPPPPELSRQSPQSLDHSSPGHSSHGQDRRPESRSEQVPPAAAERTVLTMLDAPPPAVRRSVAVPPDRVSEQRRRAARNRRRGWLALLLVLLLTTVAAAAGWYVTEGRFTSAPPLTSLTEEQAAAVAHQAGLQVDFQPEFSETVSAGVVVTTSPGPGEKVLAGGSIAAVLSQGPERYPVPRVLGLNAAAAEAALVRAHLELGRFKADYSETVPKGVVMKSSQAPGLRLRKQSLVYLTVSRGPRPVAVDDYEHRSAKRAETALEKAGFRVVVKTAHSGSVPAGDVITQTPRDGQGKAGDIVRLKKSLGPVMVRIPSVRKMRIGAATRTLRALGFAVVTRPVDANYLGLGVVSYSRPGAHTRAAKGSKITLYTV